MDFFEVVKKRRSIRKFLSKHVERELVDKIVESAMFAPSARGRRPVNLIIIDDEQIINKLYELRPQAFSFLKTSPLAFVVSVKNFDTWESDGAIAASYIQLACTALGLGSCWGHIAGRVEDDAKKLLNIQEDYRVLCVIGIGYPAEDKNPHSEDEVDKEKIHYNRW